MTRDITDETAELLSVRTIKDLLWRHYEHEPTAANLYRVQDMATWAILHLHGVRMDEGFVRDLVLEVAEDEGFTAPRG